MEIRVLGPLELVVDGRDVTPSRPKQRALLATLALRANEFVLADELEEALWGARPPQTARTALQGHISALRKLVGPALATVAGGYRLELAPEQTDIGRLESLLAEARAEEDPASRVALLRRGLDLFRGEPLPELRYEETAREEVARLIELRQSALEERIDAELELGTHAEVLPELERLVAANPLRERTRGQLMLALYRAGRQADALRAYQDGRRALAEELGLEPGPVLRELEQRILSHDPSLAPPARSEQPTESTPREERRVITVLDCEFRGFSEAGPQADPEDLRARERSLLDRVRALVDEFGGTYEGSVGAVVMAVFGAPVAHEDDPERAVRMAIAIRGELAPEAEVRIAVATGEAVVTLDTAPTPRESRVSGDVVNTAARLLSMAPAGAILVADSTRRITRAEIEYAPADQVRGGGDGPAMPAWLALDARSAPRTPHGYDTPFVGRSRELDVLRDAVARTGERREPALVTIIGVPGMGKTRLLAELRASLAHDVLCLLGRSLPYGDGVPFWALGEVVKAHADILDSDSTEAAAAKLERVVTECVTDPDERGWVSLHLRTLVGIARDGLVEERSGARGEAFSAWRRFFEGIAEQSPLVLALEDVHWADDGLLDFLDELVDASTAVPLLVVATARPELLERRPSWGGGKADATAISVGPLAPEETSRIVATRLPGVDLPTEVEDRLVERIGGNPLYAEEYASLLAEQGVDSGLPMPDSLHALIAARLDAVPPPEKTQLQDAAVVGEVFWAGALAAVGERPRAVVEELLADLQRRQLVRRRRSSSIAGQPEYSFHHVLVRDVAYGEIPRGSRGRKHRLTAEWIENLGRVEDNAELLAHHYQRAVKLSRATGEATPELERRTHLALRAAGTRAARLGAMDAAAGHFEVALELLAEDDPQRPGLMLEQGRALLVARIAGEDELLAASQAAAAAGDRLTAARAESLLGTLYQEEARGEMARQRLERARRFAEALPPGPEKGEILAEACRSLMMAGESGEALRVGMAALEIADELGLDELRAHILASIGVARCDLGDMEAGVADLERAIEFASAIHSTEAIRAYGNLSSLLVDSGDLARARELRIRAQPLAERLGLGWYLRWGRFLELDDRYHAGTPWDELLKIVEELIDERSFNVASVLQVRARIRLGRGDLDGMAADAARCVDLGRSSSDAQVLLPALALGALAAVSTGRDAEADSLIDEVLPLVRSRALPALFLLPALCLVVEQRERSEELLDLARAPATNPWWEAACAYAVGEFEGAAETYGRIGSRPDEAWARLRAAEKFTAEGALEEAGVHARAALEFFERVGATAYARRCEAAFAKLGSPAAGPSAP